MFPICFTVPWQNNSALNKTPMQLISGGREAQSKGTVQAAFIYMSGLIVKPVFAVFPKEYRWRLIAASCSWAQQSIEKDRCEDYNQNTHKQFKQFLLSASFVRLVNPVSDTLKWQSENSPFFTDSFYRLQYKLKIFCPAQSHSDKMLRPAIAKQCTLSKQIY